MKRRNDIYRQLNKIMQKRPFVWLQLLLVLQSVTLLYFMQAVTFADYDILYDFFQMGNIDNIIYNFLLFYVVLYLFYGIFRRTAIGFACVTVVTTGISVANNMKWVSLKECITLSDFEKLEEALTVVGEAEFEVFPQIKVLAFVLVLWLVLLILYDWWMRKKVRKEPFFLWGKYSAKTLLFVLVSSLLPIMMADAKMSAVEKLTESASADLTGPIIYFVDSAFTADIDEPYTQEKARGIYDSYVSQGKQIVEENFGETDLAEDDFVKPNVIVIMSEAFFDVNQFDGVLSYSENPMATYESLEKESVTYGNTRVNIFGGSTHFSEFEFLTGWNTKGMNSGSCPYKEYFYKEQPSLASYFKELNYNTLAIHPYDGYFWNRRNAYPNMGFDDFVDRSRMIYTDKCGYISDDALTNEIIDRYEKNKKNSNAPLFCFGVSIANHVAMINREEFENTANHIEITYNKDIGYSETRKKRVKEYISGISVSGEALKKLTDYFDEQEEPTVIVFFGDHAPNYAIDILRAGEKEELSYATPYLIWSNYDLENTVNSEKWESQDMNVSYLSTYLLSLLGMPLPEQSYYNIAIRNVYSFETRYAISNRQGEAYENFSLSEKEEYFNHALDIKKQIPALLEEPNWIKSIWSVSSSP